MNPHERSPFNSIDPQVLDKGVNQQDCGVPWFSPVKPQRNQEDELRRLSTNFLARLLSKPSREFETPVLADTVILHGKYFSRSRILSILSSFRDFHSEIEMEDFNIQNIHVDLDRQKAAVRGDLTYCAVPIGRKAITIDGPCILHFELRSMKWEMGQFEMPGL